MSIYPENYSVYGSYKTGYSSGILLAVGLAAWLLFTPNDMPGPMLEMVNQKQEEEEPQEIRKVVDTQSSKIKLQTGKHELSATAATKHLEGAVFKDAIIDDEVPTLSETTITQSLPEDKQDSDEFTSVLETELGDSAYEGSSMEGFNLAKLGFPGGDEFETISRWLVQGLAVLEVKTDRGLFIATAQGNPKYILRNMNFSRATPDSNDPRTRLALPVMVNGPINKNALTYRLTQNGLGSHVISYHVVFTHTAVGLILDSQTKLLAELERKTTAVLNPEYLMADVCFLDGAAVISSVKNTKTGGFYFKAKSVDC